MPKIDLGKVTGDKGVSIRNRGEWNSTAQYINDKNYLDMVTRNGCLWTCAKTNTNVEPAKGKAEWNLSAEGLSNIVFTQATARENIKSGELASIAFGKIAKWFADLKAAAFSAVANNLTTTAQGSVLDARQGKVLDDKKLDKASVVNSLLATVSGSALDAVQGKLLKEYIDEKLEYSEIECTGSIPDSFTFTIYLQKIGRIVFFTIMGAGKMALNSDGAADVIQEGWRPSRDIFATTTNHTAANLGTNYGTSRFVLTTTGSIRVYTQNKEALERCVSGVYIIAEEE